MIKQKTIGAIIFIAAFCMIGFNYLTPDVHNYGNSIFSPSEETIRQMSQATQERKFVIYVLCLGLAVCGLTGFVDSLLSERKKAAQPDDDILSSDITDNKYLN